MELYAVMHLLKSKYHMSDSQVEGSIVTVANMMFGRNWKPYSADHTTGNNSLPSMSNARRTECYAEAMVLNLIVECRMTASLVLFTQMQEEQSAMQKPWY